LRINFPFEQSWSGDFGKVCLGCHPDVLAHSYERSQMVHQSGGKNSEGFSLARKREGEWRMLFGGVV
jgi:hypothetical protein